MHPVIPTIIAFTQYGCGFYIFKAPEFSETFSPVSLVIVMVSIALLLINFRLYPRELRKLFPCGEHLIQYLMNVFLFENIIARVWLPLEAKITEIIPTIGIFLDELIAQLDGDCDVFCEVVQADYVRMITSGIFSIFLLICVLHATKIIDLRLLECGVTFFTTDITYRTRRHIKKIKKSFTKPPLPKKPFHCRNGNDDRLD